MTAENARRRTAYNSHLEAKWREGCYSERHLREGGIRKKRARECVVAWHGLSHRKGYSETLTSLLSATPEEIKGKYQCVSENHMLLFIGGGFLRKIRILHIFVKMFVPTECAGTHMVALAHTCGQAHWNIDGSIPLAVMKNHPPINVSSLLMHHLPIFNRWGNSLQKHKHWGNGSQFVALCIQLRGTSWGAGFKTKESTGAVL